jgi:hypothetical protein
MSDIEENLGKRKHRTNYKCERCERVFAYKGHYLQHINRKKKCGELLAIDVFNDFIDEFKQALKIDDVVKMQSIGKKLKIIYPNLSKTEQEEINNIYINGILDVLDSLEDLNSQ